MSDQPTQGGRADRPLWGPVRRTGDVPPPPDTLDAPPPPPGPATPGPGHPEPAPPGPSTITVASGTEWAPATDVLPGTGAEPVSGNPYASTGGGDLYGHAAPAGSSSITVPGQRPPADRIGPEPRATAEWAPSGPPPSAEWAPSGPPPSEEWAASGGMPSTPIPPRYAPPAPSRSGVSRTTLVAVSVGSAVALLLAGSGVVWALNRVPDPGPDPGPVAPVSIEPSPSSPSSSVVAAPDPTVRSASGLVLVEGAAAAHPLAGSVAELLDRHFTAINTRDYTTWTDTVSARRAADQTESGWLREYRSTQDSDVRVDSITDSGSGVTVGLRFVSRQDVVDAPSDLPVGTICWSTRWPVAGLPSAGTIGAAPKGTTSSEAC